MKALLSEEWRDFAWGERCVTRRFACEERGERWEEEETNWIEDGREVPVTGHHTAGKDWLATQHGSAAWTAARIDLQGAIVLESFGVTPEQAIRVAEGGIGNWSSTLRALGWTNMNSGCADLFVGAYSLEVEQFVQDTPINEFVPWAWFARKEDLLVSGWARPGAIERFCSASRAGEIPRESELFDLDRAGWQKAVAAWKEFRGKIRRRHQIRQMPREAFL